MGAPTINHEKGETMFREYHSKEELVDDLKASWNKRVKNYRVGGFVVGILMLILGIIACIYPVQTALVVEVIAAILLLIFGIFEIIAHFSVPPMVRTGSGIVSGILNIMMAVLLLTSPKEDMLVTFSFLMAADLLFLGIEEISAAGKLSFLGINGLGLSTAGGVLKILFSIVLILMPVASTAAASIVVGVYLIAAGITVIVTAVRAKEIKMN